MLEAQLAKIKLEKENQKLKNSLSGYLAETVQERSVLPNVTEQKEETTEKSQREPIKSTSLVSDFFPSMGKKYILVGSSSKYYLTSEPLIMKVVWC